MDRPTEFRYLQQEEVKACGGLDMAATIAAVEHAFQLYDQGEVIEQPLPAIHWGNIAGRRIAMHAAYVGGDVRIAGMKWIPSNPDNPQTLSLPRSNAFTILTAPDTGYPLAIMEGKLISDMRTGAVCGVGAKYLARPGASVVGLIGAGPINRTQLMALHHVLSGLERIVIYDLRREHAERFISDVSRRIGLAPTRFSVASSAEAAIREADVVATATNVDVTQRYIKWEWLHSGTLVVNTSVNDVEFDVVERAELVVLDSMHQVQADWTVLGECHRRGLLTEDRIAEAGAVVTGRHAGRRTDRDVVLFSPLGMGMNDVINAKRIYDAARARGIGTPLRLWDTPEWF